MPGDEGPVVAGEVALSSRASWVLIAVATAPGMLSSFPPQLSPLPFPAPSSLIERARARAASASATWSASAILRQ